MNTIPLEEITISPFRQRREHDPEAEQALVDSIMTTGLLHPVVLREENGVLVLVAGERRLRAIKEIYSLEGTFQHSGVTFDGLVPYTFLGELSPLEAEEAELEENIKRMDLTWQERAQAEARLMTLRGTQAKVAGEPAPKLPTIAAEVGVHPATLSRNVILARNLHRPEVQKAKSAPEAMKALMRAEEGEKNAAKAVALGKDFLGGKHRVFNADCIEWMRGQAEGEFDVILTDPPYGMGADEFGDSGGGAAGAHEYEDSEASFIHLLTRTAPEITRVAKPDAHLYLFCDFDRFTWLKELFTECGWKVFRTPLIWYKPSAYRAPWPFQGPQRKYETILYAVRGELRTTKLGGDVLTYAPDDNMGHMAQKPVELYKDLLSRSARPGMKVLDPFCGSGPIFPAAHALSVIATGVEKEPEFFAMAAGRVEKIMGGGK